MTNSAAESAEVDRLKARVAEVMPATVEALTDLARIPGIAFPGFDPAEVRRAAEKVRDLFAHAGCPRSEIIDIGDNPPAVYAELPGPAGSPTVLLYAHYDVQPAGELAEWESAPFEPELRDGRLYGRGVADDKSGVALHYALVRAFDAQPPCNIRIIIEGDEEYGGTFEEYPPQNPELFAADVIIIADTGNITVGQPTFTSALRGMAMVEVSVATLAAPVHSGMFGGPAPDALMALITLLATLRDADGNAAIDGVDGYQWDGAEMTEAEFREQAGVLPDQPLTGTGSVATRLFTSPAVSVVGIDAPGVEGAINAVIPKARAMVSLRVPPNVDPAEAQQKLMDHLLAHAPWGVQVSVTPGPIGAGFAGDASGTAREAMADAMRIAYGREPVDFGSGGSIPLVSVLTEVVPQAEIMLCGAQDGAAAIHAPNESLDLGELADAALTQVLFVQFLADRWG
ncbi:MAG: dipeptidase [Actinobacteria bacterium]|nr:dipeptidase [Actinomycetota bacterium]